VPGKDVEADGSRASLSTWTGAWGAIARSIGRCAAPRSEATLAAWLGGPLDRARHAALGLGDLASEQKRLREETLVSLFNAAAGGVSQPPLAEALFAVSRVDNVPPSVVERLAQVASARLAEPGPYRLFAVRALGRAREQGVSAIERVLVGKGTFTVPERVEAARAAARIGADGQVLLAEALKKLAPASEELMAPGEHDVIVALLTALKSAKDAPGVKSLASLSAPDGAGERQLRALSIVRCAAAKLMADARANDPVLVACDLSKGSIGKRALVEVLGRGEVVGPRLLAYRALLDDADVRVREAALELLSMHPEIDQTASILSKALGAKEPGVVAVAAEQIAKSPGLAGDAPKGPRRKPKKDKPGATDAKKSDDDKVEIPPPAKPVVEALRAALARAEREHDHELLGTVLDAFGALAQKEMLADVERHCGSSYPSLRKHAEGALRALTGKSKKCEPPPRADEIAPEALVAPDAGLTVIELVTDAGTAKITLDAALAPVAVARFADLVRAGYYDGNVIHRVDPSFVVQLGAPFGDGYGGPVDRTPLRCETSPLPFEELAVGVALAGRDTGSSQLFVMLGRHPHLDGRYPIVGRASGPWQQVLEGDVVKSARVVP
jgi:cyclophilin family peptidyl-prolyl cis-trans isomerase